MSEYRFSLTRIFPVFWHTLCSVKKGKIIFFSDAQMAFAIYEIKKMKLTFHVILTV